MDSNLITATLLSPNFTADRIDSKRNNQQFDIDTITPHCTAGNKNSKSTDTAKGFNNPARQASSNYTIGGAGDICLVVHEKDRSWCSGGSKNVDGETGRFNDFHAITIEVASDTSGEHVNEKAFTALKELCVDIMRRTGRTKAIWFGDDAKRMVNYKPASNEMKFTWHRWFDYRACPGKYIMDHMQELIDYCNAAFADNQTDNNNEQTEQVKVPDTEEVKPTVSKLYNVNDIVYFIGGPEYSSSNSDQAVAACQASLAKVTSVYNGKHPYHLRRVNAKGEFIAGGVYGWTDEKFITV